MAKVTIIEVDKRFTVTCDDLDFEFSYDYDKFRSWDLAAILAEIGVDVKFEVTKDG
jgi:hypothetical protein